MTALVETERPQKVGTRQEGHRHQHEQSSGDGSESDREPPQNPDCDSGRIIRSKFFEERPTVTTSVRHSPPWSMLSEGWGGHVSRIAPLVLAGADYACDASGSGCFRHKLNQSTSGAALPPQKRLGASDGDRAIGIFGVGGRREEIGNWPAFAVDLQGDESRADAARPTDAGLTPLKRGVDILRGD